MPKLRSKRQGPSITEKLESARANRYKVIHERNLLILALARHAGFEAHLVAPAINKPGEDDKWRKVLCLHTPAKQLHWRLSPEDQADFKGLPTLRKSDWDGGKAPDKAERLEQLHTLPSAIAALKADTVRQMRLAAEWGFRQAEKGHNLDYMLLHFNELLSDRQATNAVDPQVQPKESLTLRHARIVFEGE